MERIRINTGSLGNTKTEVDGCISNIENKLKTLQGDVTQLNSMWSGDANAAFNQAFQDDITYLMEVCKAMKNLSTFEGDAKREYEKCESNVSQMIAQIRI